MKKILLAVSMLFFTVISPLMAEKLVFSEFGVSYSSLITPRVLENNTTGTYDAPVFDAKVGVNILKWADVYVGGSFQFFIDRPNTQQYYTFYPYFAGIRANIFPDFCVYPDIMFEVGKAFANRHIQYALNPYQTADRDNTWTADYYSFGFGVNWKISDVSILSLRLERPTYSNLNVSYGELQAVKAGFAWKIFY